MGINTKGLTFEFSGKVGGVVGVSGKGGKQIYRGYVAKVNDKNSEGQQKQRARQTSLVALHKVFAPGMKNAFPKKAGNRSDYNEFIAANSRVFAEAVDPEDSQVWNQTVLGTEGLPRKADVAIVYGPNASGGKLIAECTYTPYNDTINTEGTVLQLNLYNPNLKTGRSVSYTTKASGEVKFYVRLGEYGIEDVQFAARTGRNPRTGEELYTCDGDVTATQTITVTGGADVI